MSEMPRQPSPADALVSAAAVPTVTILAWSCLMLWLCLTSGAMHDYVWYLDQWALVLAGSDPWSTNNAYGPVHNLLAALLPLGELAPKTLTVLALLLANAWLAWALWRSRGAAGVQSVYLLAVPTNFLVVGMGVIYGLNDALVAALIIAAALARFRRCAVLSGVLIGVAALDKYYPILLVLPFALSARRLSLPLVFSAASTFIAGMVAGYWIWGDAIFRAIQFGTERGPKLLSILAALENAPDLIGGQTIVDWLVSANAAFVVAGAIATLWASWWLRWHWLECTVATLLAVLLTYKVGHQQFYIPWLALVAALPLVGTRRADRFALACIPMILFLSLFQWGYQFGSDGYRRVMIGARQYGGFVAFPLSVLILAAWVTISRWETRRDRSRHQSLPVSHQQ